MVPGRRSRDGGAPNATTAKSAGKNSAMWAWSERRRLKPGRRRFGAQRAKTRMRTRTKAPHATAALRGRGRALVPGRRSDGDRGVRAAEGGNGRGYPRARPIWSFVLGGRLVIGGLTLSTGVLERVGLSGGPSACRQPGAISN